ncbi:MAG: amidohydrolase family protein, partial [Saprospiraceae bacterium]
FFMKKIITLALLTCLAVFQAIAQNASKTYELRNGAWYNGQDFSIGNWYMTGGILTRKAPAKVDSVIDLTGKWIVPPLADAYCSSLSDNPNAKMVTESYMGEGVFYLQILSNSQEDRKALSGLVNTASTPDAVFANGGITCTLGEPCIRFEAPAQNIRNPQMIAQRYDQIKLLRAMLGNGYWFIDNKTALDANWKKIEEQKPDLISIYLLDAANSGGKEGKGLTPDVAKLVVKKAHRAKLRVYAHVETADDVRLATKLGVDGIANLPAAADSAKVPAAKLEAADWAKLAKKKTPVVPLLSHAQTLGAGAGSQETQAQHLKELLDNGVQVVIGSDDPQRTIRAELNYWFQNSRIDYGKALQIVCVATPQAIFPGRKIGRFEEGYEASFLVLDDNPLNNILKLRAISWKAKRGKIIAPIAK